MLVGQLFAVGTGYSQKQGVLTEQEGGFGIGLGQVGTEPDVLMRPIYPAPVNQRTPSGPVVIPSMPVWPGTEYSVITPTSGQLGTLVVGQILPIFSPKNSVNHKAPSGPALMLVGQLFAVGTGYSQKQGVLTEQEGGFGIGLGQVGTERDVLMRQIYPAPVKQRQPFGPVVLPSMPVWPGT